MKRRERSAHVTDLLPDSSYDVFLVKEGSAIVGSVVTLHGVAVGSFRSTGEGAWRTRLRRRLAKEFDTHPTAFNFWVRDDGR